MKMVGQVLAGIEDVIEDGVTNYQRVAMHVPRRGIDPYEGGYTDVTRTRVPDLNIMPEQVVVDVEGDSELFDIWEADPNLVVLWSEEDTI
jgi:hypothetical protein